MTAAIRNNGGSQLDVEVGGLVVATFDGAGLATGVKAGSIDATKLATALNTTLGVGATRQNLTASRSFGVNYTNGSSPMYLSVAGNPAVNAGGTVDITAGTHVIRGNLGAGTGGATVSGTTRILPGEVYQVNYSLAGGLNSVVWLESRA